LAAGCVVKNSTTAAPERLAHLERLRCVSRAVLGIEKSAASVILVCATSRCVNFVNFGSKVSNTELGRMVHSWKLILAIGNADGRLTFSITSLKESLNAGLEQAQKSSAFNLGRSQRRVLMTFESTSSSICSCAKNSLKFGVSLRH
jgi:hypothetical protein